MNERLADFLTHAGTRVTESNEETAFTKITILSKNRVLLLVNNKKVYWKIHIGSPASGLALNFTLAMPLNTATFRAALSSLVLCLPPPKEMDASLRFSSQGKQPRTEHSGKELIFKTSKPYDMGGGE